MYILENATRVLRSITFKSLLGSWWESSLLFGPVWKNSTYFRHGLFPDSPILLPNCSNHIVSKVILKLHRYDYECTYKVHVKYLRMYVSSQNRFSSVIFNSLKNILIFLDVCTHWQQERIVI